MASKVALAKRKEAALKRMFDAVNKHKERKFNFISYNRDIREAQELEALADVLEELAELEPLVEEIDELKIQNRTLKAQVTKLKKKLDD